MDIPQQPLLSGFSHCRAAAARTSATQMLPNAQSSQNLLGTFMSPHLSLYLSIEVKGLKEELTAHQQPATATMPAVLLDEHSCGITVKLSMMQGSLGVSMCCVLHL